MYINPFLAGVLSTILVIALGFLAYGAYLNHKDKK